MDEHLMKTYRRCEPVFVRGKGVHIHDEEGRIYIAEMRDYPLGPPAGSIRLLEDGDGDGHLDRSDLFASGVPFSTSVLPWRGGVLVSCAFEILYPKDTDSDRKADVRRTVLSGFGKGNSQHLLNGLKYGLDNWIYASNGLSGGIGRGHHPPTGRRSGTDGAPSRYRRAQGLARIHDARMDRKQSLHSGLCRSPRVPSPRARATKVKWTGKACRPSAAVRETDPGADGRHRKAACSGSPPDTR